MLENPYTIKYIFVYNIHTHERTTTGKCQDFFFCFVLLTRYLNHFNFFTYAMAVYCGGGASIEGFDV